MAYKEKKIAIPDTISSLKPVKTLNKIQCYKTNPFLNASGGFEFHTAEKIKTVGITGEMNLKTSEGEEQTQHVGAIWQRETYDLENYIKFYTHNAKFFFDLSSQAVKVITALFYIVQTNCIKTDEVFFTYDIAVDAWNNLKIEKIPSQSTFTRGKSDLMKFKILCGNAKGVGWYFINPHLIFNGDRISFIKTAILERQQENKSLDM